MASRKGSPNKSTLLRKWIGIQDRDPALFLLAIMQNNDAPMPDRIDAAKTLLPYVHRKQPVEIDTGDSPLQVSNIIIEYHHAPQIEYA